MTTVLDDGYPLDMVQAPGSYTVKDPDDAPATGEYYVEVFTGKVSNSVTQKQVITDLTTGAEFVRVYVRYTGWSAWTQRGDAAGVDTDLTVGNKTATTLDVLSSTGADATIPAATDTEAGLFTAAMKVKLDGIAESADAFINTDLSVANRTATTLDILSSTGVDATIPAASSTEAGLMSAADKVTIGTVATAASTFGTDNRLLRSDGTGRGLQSSGITISDADAISGVTGLTFNSGSVISFNAGDVTITHAANALYVIGANQFTVQQGGTYPHTIMERTDTHGAGVATGMISFYGRDSGGTSELYGYIYALANDDTATSEDGSFVFGLPVAGTFGDRMAMTGTALYPTTSDGMALGLSVRMWSDLFLASGGVINFNAGDVTITHAANNLTFSGANSYYFSQSAAVTQLVIDRSDTHGSAAGIGFLSFLGRDAAGNSQEYARVSSYATDATNASEDGSLYFGVVTAGTFVDELYMSGTFFSPTTDDGLSLGQSGLGFSDLF
jgi:hypothetical protein